MCPGWNFFFSFFNLGPYCSKYLADMNKIGFLILRSLPPQEDKAIWRNDPQINIVNKSSFRIQRRERCILREKKMYFEGDIKDSLKEIPEDWLGF